MPLVEIVVSTLNSGGIANVVRSFSKALQSLSIFSNVITLQNNVPDDLLAQKVISLDVNGHKSNIFKIYVAMKRIIKYRMASRPNMAKIHFCMDPSSLLVSFVSNIYRKHEYVAWCATPKELLVFSDKLIIKFFYHRINSVVVPNIGLRLDLLELNPKAKISVIPNPLSLIENSCAWPKLVTNNGREVLYLGRFSGEKGVEMIPKLALKNPDISFSMVGEGPLLELLLKQKEKSSISNLTILPWGDARKYLEEASLIILPSIYESFGLVVIESWIYGKPVIAADLASGPNNLISEYGGGLLVKNYEDLDEWSDKIQIMINTELDANFIANIITVFSAESIVKKWLDLTDLAKNNS